MHIPFVSSLMNLSPIKRQSVIQLGFTILVTLAGFVSTMIFSHLLGKDLMGVFYLFCTYFSIFNLIGDSGFGEATVKRISEGKDQNEYFTAYMTLRTILIIVSTLILLLIQPLFVDLATYQLVPLIILALVVAYFAHGISIGVRAKNHVGIYNTGLGISELVRIGLSILLVFIGFSVYGMIGGYIVGLLLSGLLCIKYFKYRPAKFTRYHLKNLLTFSLWILLISAAGTIMGYADTIFIGYFMNNGDVGVYRVALSFTMIALFIANAVYSTLPPKISYWSTHNKMEEIPPVISRSITYGLVLAIPAAVGGILLVDELLYFFYGADFAEGSVCCCILLFQQVVNVFLMFIGVALSNSGYVRKTFYGTLAALILNVVLDIILIPGLGPIPAFGINGAAIGSLVAIIVNVVIVGYLMKKIMTFKIEGKPLIHIII
ncbi:MAG TPA: flippase, partial [Methanocorpusculum sp.]|nr:flippase [Methanocorpusculum sp.]